MTDRELLHILDTHRVAYRSGNGAEISLSCPRCSRYHANNKPTLYLNTKSWYWLCFRCEPKNAGRDVKGFLKLFNLERYAEQSSGFTFDEGVTLESLLLGDKQLPPEPEAVTLPEGYRQDWAATVTGKAVLRYLRGRLSDSAIRASRSGYVVSGPLAGCAVFPVYINGELRFWQARRVLYSGGSKYTAPSIEKTDILYGYDWLEDGGEANLVEGIFDALATPNGVGLLGKSLSVGQIGLLSKKHLRSVTVTMDGDAWSAARRIARQIALYLTGAVTVNLIVNAARLPADKDPATSSKVVDTFIVR